MDSTWGVGVPDSAVIMLAQLILKRAKLRGLPCQTRQQAIGIIKGCAPALTKTTPLNIPSAIGRKEVELSRCIACGKPLPIGSVCRTLWTTYEGEHIKCHGRAQHASR